MKSGSRANALLVELLIVIFFFMLTSVILVQLFADAKIRSVTARATNSAMLETQNIAEELYAAEDPEGFLGQMGFTGEAGEWILQRNDYVLHVAPTVENMPGGVLKTWEIRATRNDQVLITLPSTRYLPEEVSP